MNYKKILKVVGVVAVAAVFSIGCSEKPDDEGGGGDKGSDISKYKTVKIGTQTWMAENLDNAVSGSVCYNNSADSCSKYGRLYTWEAAKSACPSGWHLPSDAEWETLTTFAGGEEIAGKKLKYRSGWNSYDGVSGNGTDDYGFSALPGGGGLDGDFYYAGLGGLWWTTTQYDADAAIAQTMGYGFEGVNGTSLVKADLLSVRCVQN